MYIDQVPQKILFVIDHFKTSNAGTESQLFMLINQLDRRRFYPELLVFSSSEWLDNNNFPCPVHILGSRSLSSPTTWWRLFQFAIKARSEGIRIAHVYFNDPSLICPPIFKITGIRTLISRRDMGYWYTPKILKLLRITARMCEGAVVNSEAVAQITIDSEGFTASRVHVIYNGYEPKTVQFNPVALLESLKNQKRLLVGVVANIRPIKRIEDMILAVALLKDEVETLDFVHIGEGDPSLLFEIAKDLGVEHRVHFLGGRDDINNCLSYMDIAALCSESEGFSNALIEYLQAGLPVVCSDVGGNSEAVQSGVNGLLYESGDVATLAKHLSRIAQDNTLRLKLGLQAQEDAKQRYSVDNMILAHQTLYSSKIERNEHDD